MSKILKKITKKYKWLRFLNYKTTKLAVLSTALFGLCLSSGASFAKYRDENYGNGNAGTAKFEYGRIVPLNEGTIKQPTDQNQIFEGVHAFVHEFQLIIPYSEIKLTYSLKLRLVSPVVTNFDAGESELTHTSFISNKTSGEFYVFSRNDKDEVITVEKSLKDIMDVTELEYKAGYWFCSVETETSNGTEYELKTSNVFDYDDVNKKTTDIITVDSGTILAGSSVSKKFKIVVFVEADEDINNDNEIVWSAENSKTLYKLHLEQVV